MNLDFALLQAYWLFLLPFPWLWLYWRLRHIASSWPKILPVLTIRYPLLEDLNTTKEIKIWNIEKKKKIYPREYTMAIAFGFMLLALSQPVRYSSFSEQQESSEPVDLILAVDTALSMSLSDYEIEGRPVSRIGISRLLLNTFIKDFSGSRIGLVILGNPPALWLPLTSDKAVVQDAVSRINTFLGGRITDMGATLKLIQDQFKDHQEKVVVLISDGGTQVGSVSPQNAAKQLAAEGFALYIIAVGSDDPDAGSLDNSSLIYEAANIKMLQEVADHGNGTLFHALNSQGFSDALKTIEVKHRKPVVQQNKIKLIQPWYPVPMVIAMLLFLYAGLLQQSSSHSKREEAK